MCGTPLKSVHMLIKYIGQNIPEKQYSIIVALMNYLQCMHLAVLNSDVDLRLFDVNDAHHYKPEGHACTIHHKNL